MVIKYIWHENPDVVKTFDTVKAYKKNPGIFRGTEEGITQADYDSHNLDLFARDKAKGLVLDYWIEGEEAKR